MLKWLGLWLAVVLLGFAAACGGDDNGDPTRSTPAPLSPVATATITVGDDATPVPTELRVAYINLESPVALDTTNSEASDTYDQRLAMVIAELKDFRPDVVGFSEATNTKAHGNAVATLARELKMEPQTVRANPWYPDASTEQNDEIAKQSGFEEFEVMLTRSAFPILKAESRWLNPRTSETEGRAALHVVVKAPGIPGNVDVYITHLTGGGDKVRAPQATSVMNFIQGTRGTGPLILVGDLSDNSDSGAYKAFTDGGLHDLGLQANLPTCCRDTVVGVQAALTTRTDYIFADRWTAPAPQLWGDTPGKQTDGKLLYPSDHNGLMAVFPLMQAPIVPPR